MILGKLALRLHHWHVERGYGESAIVDMCRNLCGESVICYDVHCHDVHCTSIDTSKTSLLLTKEVMVSSCSAFRDSYPS